MDHDPQNNRQKRAQVDIQLLRYMLLLLNISNDDLAEIKKNNDTNWFTSTPKRQSSGGEGYSTHPTATTSIFQNNQK